MNWTTFTLFLGFSAVVTGIFIAKRALEKAVGDVDALIAATKAATESLERSVPGVAGSDSQVLIDEGEGRVEAQAGRARWGED